MLNLNPYHRRLGLAFGAAALLVLLISSTGQSAVSYAQLANAYSQVTQKCPHFPNPLDIAAGFLTGQNGVFQYANNTSSKWYQQHTYVKLLNLGGLDLNSTTIFIGVLSAKVFVTQEWFYNNTGHIQKGSSVNTTYTVNVYKFSATVIGQQAKISVNEAQGIYETISADGGPISLSVQVQNVKATISCGAT